MLSSVDYKWEIGNFYLQLITREKSAIAIFSRQDSKDKSVMVS